MTHNTTTVKILTLPRCEAIVALYAGIQHIDMIDNNELRTILNEMRHLSGVPVGTWGVSLDDMHSASEMIRYFRLSVPENDVT